MKENEKVLQCLLKRLNNFDKQDSTDNSRNIFVQTMAYVSGLKINCDKDSDITFREALCLALLVMGNSTHHCAELLGISYHTVQQHEKNARRKLNVKSRATAFYKACFKNYLTFIDHNKNTEI